MKILLAILMVVQFYSTSPYIQPQRQTMSEQRVEQTYPYVLQQPVAGSCPHRSPGRPLSGDWPTTLDELWMALNGNWPGYVDDDYWEEFLRLHPEYKEYVEEWYRKRGQDPPFATPVGAPGPGLVLFLVGAYMIFVVWIHKEEGFCGENDTETHKETT